MTPNYLQLKVPFSQTTKAMSKHSNLLFVWAFNNELFIAQDPRLNKTQNTIFTHV
jgi:hypothetical protein